MMYIVERFKVLLKKSLQNYEAQGARRELSPAFHTTLDSMGMVLEKLTEDLPSRNPW